MRRKLIVPEFRRNLKKTHKNEQVNSPTKNKMGNIAGHLNYERAEGHVWDDGRSASHNQGTRRVYPQHWGTANVNCLPKMKKKRVGLDRVKRKKKTTVSPGSPRKGTRAPPLRVGQRGTKKKRNRNAERGGKGGGGSRDS